MLTLPFLTGCAAMGLAETAALVVTGAVGFAAAVAADIGESSPVKVYGNYGDDHGFWFDRDLFSVSVISESPEESKQVAHDTAINSCAQRDKILNVVKPWDCKSEAMAIFTLSKSIAFPLQ